MPFLGPQAALTSTSEDGPPEGAWILASLFLPLPTPSLEHILTAAVSSKTPLGTSLAVSLVVKTPGFQCRGCGFSLLSGN